ncbi:LysR substrate-binding domain-containing protein [Paenarthrobacter sp. YAF11_1]|uniref:LysR substrate-binding domain-containing protein n=1 Tax=Paenarthrobacter sp. YAF11_1 TaxID=3233074 RepID=UPI003F993284
MRISELVWFMRVAETGNVTQTSAELHMSQPALTRALQRLEEELGAELFARHKKRLLLNESGEILFPHAARAVSEIQAAKDRIKALQNPHGGSISLTFVTSYGSWLVPQLLSDFQKTSPQSHFTLRGCAADDVLASIRSGEADAGIMSPRPADPSLEWIPLASEPLGLATSIGADLSRRTTITPSDLHELPIMALRKEFGLRQITDSYLAGHGLVPNIILEATELSTLWGLVQRNVGVAILPAREPPTGVKVIPFEDRDAVRLAGLVYDPQRRLPPSGDRFISFIRSREDHP